jgi:hypothetical protein
MGWFLQYQSAPSSRFRAETVLTHRHRIGRGTLVANHNVDANEKGFRLAYSTDWFDYSGTHHTEPIDINCH